MHRFHALPDGWEQLNYHEFLQQRRDLMAAVIREAYEKLSAGRSPEETKVVLPVDMLVDAGEGELIEFKSTLRVNLHTGQKDPRLELAIVKTISGFLNTTGGTLVVGVSDDGVPVGLGSDGFPNEDRMNLYLVDLLNSWIGAAGDAPRLSAVRGLSGGTGSGSRVPAVKVVGLRQGWQRSSASTSEPAPPRPN